MTKRWILLTTLMFCLGWFGALRVHASHVFGADLTATCVTACTVRIQGRVYYDCSVQAPPFSSNTTWVPQIPGCTAPPTVGPISAVTYTDITPTCPAIASWCAAPLSSAYGVGEIKWYQDYDICAVAPCVFAVNWSDCCRPNFVDNIMNPGTTGYGLTTTVNTYLTPCNSGPSFIDPPISWICNDRDQYIHQGAFDPDGDSLAYELGPCMGSTGSQVTYIPNCFPSGPYGANWSVTIDSTTGIVFFDAHPGGPLNAIVCIYIREYRNGVLIGMTSRDMLVMAQNCAGNTNPEWTPPANLSGGVSVVGNDIYICASGNFCFDISPIDLDVGQGLRIWWDGLLPGATFSAAGNGNIQDTVPGTTALPPVGRFCWTPPGNGVYPLRLHLEDDFCPLNGRHDKVYWLHVNTTPPTVVVTAGTCPQVQFALTGCVGNGQTYTWSGGGGLNSTAANFSHTYPSVGSYNWQVIVAGGSQIDTLTGTVVVNGGPIPQPLINGNHDLDACAGRISDTLIATSGFTSYQWNTGATSATIVTGYVPGVYVVEAYDAAGCGFIDTALVNWIQPDISGRVTTSNTAPLVNQEIYLIRHDTMLQALVAIDSVQTNLNGLYHFCNVTDTLVFIKAAPDSGAYPTEMPTYADTTLFWNHAVTFYPLLQLPLVHDFSTLYGTNPGGPGFIGGLITQGANKMSAIGDPVPGLRVFLRDANTDMILGHRVTDMNGYFSFAGIPLGDYEVVPDKPNVSTTNVPALALTAQTQVLDSLDFQLHSTWLELVLHPNGVVNSVPQFQLQVSPNPFAESTQVMFHLNEDSDLEWDVYDAMGRRLSASKSMRLTEGTHPFEIGASLPCGIYFLRIQVNGEARSVKIIKSK
ncbi:MAG: T9SS type A sorting domain-containing protein [Bacteroidetes bacterium]|nr:T9SS type A sorting domain-containing protein [Bacteroidota bacterium]